MCVFVFTSCNPQLPSQLFKAICALICSRNGASCVSVCVFVKFHKKIRVRRIELRAIAWKAIMLPLHHTRINIRYHGGKTDLTYYKSMCLCVCVVLPSHLLRVCVCIYINARDRAIRLLHPNYSRISVLSLVHAMGHRVQVSTWYVFIKLHKKIRVRRIELRAIAWKAIMLPLHHTRLIIEGPIDADTKLSEIKSN